MTSVTSKILQRAVALGVSDIHMATGQPIFFRRDGVLAKEDFAFDEGDILSVLSEGQTAKLRESGQLDFAFENVGNRFRGNAYLSMGKISLMLRVLPKDFPSMSMLGDTDGFKHLTFAKEGLILVTGRTGSGKTTTLFALLNEMISGRPVHILTLEDPVEYVVPHGASFISQREYGTDFYTFDGAVKAALREMPDIILIGEIRDAQTMRAALTAAQTGVLVLGSLHTKNAVETAMRVEGMFPENERASVRDEFAAVLTATIAQRLVPAAECGRTLAAEVLTATPAVRNLIRQGKYGQMATAMLNGADGMQTFAVSYKKLLAAGKITAEVFAELNKTI